jgi:hypothetical protein
MAPNETHKPAAEPSSKDGYAAAEKEMDQLAKADEVPSDPSEWPSGKAKMLTFGAGDDAPYGEGATAKLGPAEVMHLADGSVSVGGEQVDNPEDYKGEPIPGGPTDPNSPELAGERKRSAKSETTGNKDNN